MPLELQHKRQNRLIPEAKAPQIKALPLVSSRRVKVARSAYVATARPTPPVKITKVVRPFIPDTHEQRRAKALDVLLAARALLRQDGWKRGSLYGVGGWSLGAALMQSGDTVSAEWARWVIRGILFDVNIPAWADHSCRERRDIFRILQRAIARCRKSIPLGGWLVSSEAP